MELNVTPERRGNAEVNGELNERVSGASRVQREREMPGADKSRNIQ